MITLLNSAIASSPDEFWQEYQTAAKNGTVRSPIEHVMNLSTKLETDSPQRLAYKKSAILWFMATGGKHGFRKEPATSVERDLMVKALIFATILHEINSPKSFLPIIVLRREAGLVTEDQKTKTHLAETQKVITATHIFLYGSSENVGEIVQQLFNKEYVEMALYSKNLNSISRQQWEQEAQDFSSIFTLKFDRTAKAIFSNDLNLSVRDGYFGLIEPVTETTAEKFRQLILKNCTPDPELYPQSQPVIPRDATVQLTARRSMNVVTDSFAVERDAAGKTTFKFTKMVKIGCMTNHPGSTLSLRETDMGSFKLSPKQTEEEFLSVIRRLANIENVTYS